MLLKRQTFTLCDSTAPGLGGVEPLHVKETGPAKDARDHGGTYAVLEWACYDGDAGEYVPTTVRLDELDEDEEGWWGLRDIGRGAPASIDTEERNFTLKLLGEKTGSLLASVDFMWWEHRRDATLRTWEYHEMPGSRSEHPFELDQILSILWASAGRDPSAYHDHWHVHVNELIAQVLGADDYDDIDDEDEDACEQHAALQVETVYVDKVTNSGGKGHGLTLMLALQALLTEAAFVMSAVSARILPTAGGAVCGSLMAHCVALHVAPPHTHANKYTHTHTRARVHTYMFYTRTSNLIFLDKCARAHTHACAHAQ